MDRKCDLCDERAVLRDVSLEKGQERTIYLCLEHAIAHGYENIPEQIPGKITKKLQTQRTGSRRRLASCNTCGLTLAAFRRHGVLGCPDCYHAFERHLEPVIGRAQAGATHHCGHTPVQEPAHVDRQLHRTRLLKDLNEAVSSEQYERAAQIRDKIKHLEGSVESERE